jgi:hypothetical protein
MKRMTRSEFVEAMEALGGEFDLQEGGLVLRIPRGRMPDWARREWPGWKDALEEQTVGGVRCRHCGVDVLAWTWDEFADVLCYPCRRLPLRDEL